MMSILAGDTIASIMRSAPVEQLEARMLIGHVTQLTRVQLITQSERALNTAEAEQLNTLFQRRIAGEPMAYLLGEREFFGLTFQVDPAVLIPRPDTELLVELALQHLPLHGRVLDMGTGSGAIAIAIAHTRRDAHVTALDVSENALLVAQGNAKNNQVDVEFLRSDWFVAIAEQQFDLIVSNPPYIVAGDRHLSEGDLRFEPIDALTDHADGLSALRIISQQAARYLSADGWLLMEHGYDQAEAVRDLLSENNFTEVQSWCDLANIERVSGGKKSRTGS
ncbi:peptide chain release factor N(5)-glutamine methyltransferase [Herminiimonas fonticola]|uniref:Release factor glutamine methyltransferase n=1 Tax=Herminiimonas fonticola TaxID=303380 RepID=A0A4R6GFH2_9BURK|nr:peptide chain release factor N(5)-glutamine methyltransferase [Herminiimonas fonticola]RBA24390.1 protein-(glutamine-N5) methyltransferase, release factor-specific [Herminiimonas fonticola]TDN93507.1 [protein release factor]-glutamine N5-methyltransferase [Herminiimonas fonticola]